MVVASYQELVRRALCLSLTAAVLIWLQAFMDSWAYIKAGAFGAGLTVLVASAAVACAVPCIAYRGARRNSAKWLGAFSGCSYLSGCCDCLFVCMFTFVASVLYGARDLVTNCRETPSQFTCPDELLDRMQSFCLAFDDRFGRNVTEEMEISERAWNVTLSVNWTSQKEFHEVLAAAECLELLGHLGSAGLAFILLSLLLRCLSMCCHCLSGVYGVELYTLLEEARYGSTDSGSDSGDDDADCGGSDGSTSSTEGRAKK